ncbi:MAG: OmpA family protein [Robiginitomaculum sp.]
MKMKLVLLGTALLVLSACASTPKQKLIAQKVPVQKKTPPPVSIVPAPVAPVIQTPTARVVMAGPFPGTIDDFRLQSGDDRVYFGYDRADLDGTTRTVLSRQAAWLNQYGSTIIVIGGNADERGTREYNLALGARRAESVKSFFINQGVSPSRITTVSYGKERPIDGRSNEAAWRLNRNAHTAVLVGGDS